MKLLCLSPRFLGRDKNEKKKKTKKKKGFWNLRGKWHPPWNELATITTPPPHQTSSVSLAVTADRSYQQWELGKGHFTLGLLQQRANGQSRKVAAERSGLFTGNSEEADISLRSSGGARKLRGKKNDFFLFLTYQVVGNTASRWIPVHLYNVSFWLQTETV